MADITSIIVKKETKEKIRILGEKGDTYDKLINVLLDFYNKNFKG